MKVRFLILWLCSVLFALVLPLSALAGGGCEETLKQVETKVGKLSTEEFSVFFQSYNNECLKNVVYREWVNELLFSVISKQPFEFLETLEKQDEKRAKAILSEFESLIHDNIDIKLIYATIKSTNTKSEMKQRVLQALRVAGKKYGMEFGE